MTPESIYRDQVRAVCGDESVEAMLTLFRELEAATLELEAHAMGLTFPVPGMFTSQSYPGELQLHLVLVRQHYEDALKAARRALELSAPGGLAYVEYWVGRLEFGAGYLNTIEASRRSRRLEQKGDMASAAREAEKAFEVGRKAIEAYARVARNQSDRGAIAILGNYVYLPLRTEVARLRKREAQ